METTARTGYGIYRWAQPYAGIERARYDKGKKRCRRIFDSHNHCADLCHEPGRAKKNLETGISDALPGCAFFLD